MLAVTLALAASSTAVLLQVVTNAAAIAIRELRLVDWLVTCVGQSGSTTKRIGAVAAHKCM